MYIVNVQLSCVLKCFLFCAKRGFLAWSQILLVLLVFYQLHNRGTRLTVNLNVLLLTYYRHKRLSDLREGRSFFGVVSQTTIKHFTEVRGAEITMLTSKILRCVLKGRKKRRNNCNGRHCRDPLQLAHSYGAQDQNRILATCRACSTMIFLDSFIYRVFLEYAKHRTKHRCGSRIFLRRGGDH